MHPLSLLRFVALGALFVSPLRAAERAPNLIVILADDLGWADLGHDGSKIDTPNLDRLAKEGVKLTHYRSSAPMCSPTRAALLTGRYPHSVGVPELASPDARGNVPILALAHAAITIPEALKPAGYRSSLVGKWHIGHAEKNWPRTHGFDEFWGSLIGTPRFWEVKETFANETPIEVTGKGYYTDQLAAKAVEFIRRDAAAEKPFFLYLAFNAPHYPLEAPFELVQKYRRLFPDRGLFALYAAMVERLDTGIGQVLATLDELKLAQNTLVVFTSDNGPSAELNHYGPEGADDSNGPLRGYKVGLTEGGLRVPFLARWPGKIPAGTVSAGPAITMDLLPTLLDAAGVKPAAYSMLKTADYLPRTARWIKERVAEFDPDGSKVVTESGTALPYDFLVVATGLALDYEAIEGMDRALIGREGIASVYAGPTYAEASWRALAASPCSDARRPK